MALRGHLDTVRSVAIASGQGITLVTGGDDNTVKLWSVDVQRMSSRSPTRSVLSDVRASKLMSDQIRRRTRLT
jgi:WD40 repeat protein